jgi:hypothetical protein
MEGRAARGETRKSHSQNYENDSNNFTRMRLICRSMFSLGEATGHRDSDHSGEFEVRC